LGNYDQFFINPKKYLARNYFANCISPNVEIKMTKEKGRGVFASKPIKKRDLICAERAISAGSSENEFLECQIPDATDSI
jgi:hypothetical protein